MSIVGAFIMPHPPVILPEVGRGREREIAATIRAFNACADRLRALAPETVVIVSPHATAYADYFHISPGSKAAGDMARFGAPEATLRVRYDEALVQAISAAAARANVPAGTLGEREKDLDHGAFVPLYMVRFGNSDAKLVRIGLSGLSPLEHYRLGQAIAEAASALNRRVAFIASGDLSHKLTADGPYGFAPEGAVYDEHATHAMASGNFLDFLTISPELVEAAAACGTGSFQVMAGALNGVAVKPELLSYEGPFGVGYAVAAFEPLGPDEARRFGEAYLSAEAERLARVRAGESPIVQLARRALESFVLNGKRLTLPENLPEWMLKDAAGVFVSIKKRGRLRGCIGTIQPVTACIAEEVLRNAVSAGREDPRFDPVEAAELPELTYSVDVLGKPEPAEFKDLDPQKYGVIVTSGFKRGLLLPMLEGVDTVEEQVEIAKRKAGIGAREPVTYQRFQVVRYK
jgi:AmmeMemoRadiSam system protein A/AmmeMemoRadiSam system protein B